MASVTAINKDLALEFTIDRDYLHFKIAGGAKGNPRGSFDGGWSVGLSGSREEKQRPEWRTWNIKKFRGKKGAGKISRRIKGWMGFVSADHFVLSDLASTPKSGASPMPPRSIRLACFHEATFEPEQKSRCYFCSGHALCLTEPKGIGLKIRRSMDGTHCMTVEPSVFLPLGLLKQREGYIEFMQSLLSVAALTQLDMVELLHGMPVQSQEIPVRLGVSNREWQDPYHATRSRPRMEGICCMVPHHYWTTHHNLWFSGMEYKTRR